MRAPKEILELIKRFEQNSDAYLSGRYNETQLRREFLDPFFKALGWDIDNVAGYAEAYKDVIHEDAIRIGSYLKAPDYCFRIGGTRKFFVEAKKPSISIADETPSAFQLRRYAWSAKLPLSILSDFEEFAVYDCRIKPDKSDSAAAARVFYCTYREFAEKWEWIASIFSRDAVLKGSFDKYAEANKAKRGTAEVNDDILATIEGWRNDLAHNIALRNPDLSQRELNFAVQRIIDRILFLRICEDRGIEIYGRLLALTNGPNIYPRLGELFHDADARYNSGLFHFKVEKSRNEPPDELTIHLDIDDKLLGGLLKQLYYPESPYEFTVLPADILGQVYEQFLGKAWDWFGSAYPKIASHLTPSIDMEKVPIRVIQSSNKSEVSRYNRIKELSKQMIALYKQFPSVKTPREQESKQRQITATDMELDQLVYELYGLTKDEIKVIEEAGA